MRRSRSSKRAVTFGAAALIFVACSSNGEGSPFDERSDDEDRTSIAASTATLDEESTPVEGTNVAQDTVAGVDLAGRLAGKSLGLSPDGSRIVTATNDQVCVYDVATLDAEFCTESGPIDLDNIEQTLREGDQVVWSPDSRIGAFTSNANPDMSLLLPDEQSIVNINDDGLIDSSPDGLGATPSDRPPTWVDGGAAVAFIQASPDFDISLAVLDVESQSITRQIPLPTIVNNRGITVSRLARSFVVMASGSDRVTLVGDGSVFDVDLDTEAVTEIVDFSANYQGNAPGLATPNGGSLAPLAMIGADELLVSDRLATQTISNGLDSGSTSGLLIIDLETGELTDVFEQSPPTDGWVGPTAVAIDPVTDDWIVWWVDSSVRNEDIDAAVGILSVIDPAAAEFPVNPRDLPVLYNSTDVGEWLLFVPELSLERLQVISVDRLVAAQTHDGNTLLLRLT